MESSFPIETFKFGLDTRRDVLTSQAGTLVTALNVFVNQGGELEKRKAFTTFADLDISDSNGHSALAGVQSTEDGIIAYSHARELEEAYVSTTGSASVNTSGPGSGATFNITAASGAITVAVVNAGGSGYAVGDRLTLTTAVGTGAILTVATLAVTAVATVTITNNGNPQVLPFLVSTMPSGVTHQLLKHPSLTNDTAEVYSSSLHRLDVFSTPPNQILFSNGFNGKAFVSATFADGNTYLYYDGALVQDSANGLVLSGRTGLADLGNDLARQIQEIGWEALANRQVVTLTSITRVTTTATATYAAHGLSNGDFVEIYGATQTQYNGKFRIYGVTTDTFNYTMSSDPGASASGSPQATVYQAGSVIIKSPPQDYWGASPEETSSAGQLGVSTISQDGSGVPGNPAIAQFRITVSTGTFTLTAPEEPDGTGIVDLCNGAVTARATAAESATAIVAAINDLSYIHGYTATSTSADVFVYADITWGDVTQNGTVSFLLNVTTTTGTVAVVGTTPPFFFGISPVNVEYGEIFAAPTVTNLTTIGHGDNLIPRISVSGGTTPYIYGWAPASPGSDGEPGAPPTSPRRITPRIFPSGEIYFTILGTVTTPIDITGVFRITATDSSGPPANSNSGLVTCRLYAYR